MWVDSSLRFVLCFLGPEHADHHQAVPGVLSTLHGQSGFGGRETQARH